MPELPEVETIRRDLLSFKSDVFTEHIFCRNGVRNICRPEFIRQNLAQKIWSDVKRYGKHLRIVLSHSFSLWIHLGMSGQLFFQTEAPTHDPHIHFWAFLKRKKESGYLIYRDVRRFGRLKLLEDSQERMPDFIERLGEDPFTIKTGQLKRKLSSRKSSLKTLLLNQQILAGVGNIYADESLFAAKIHPLKKGNKLSETETTVLIESLQRTLKASIARGGTTLRDYRNANGQKGDNQKYLKVYGQEGKPCQNCGNVIKKIVLAARSTFFCPACQKK